MKVIGSTKRLVCLATLLIACSLASAYASPAVKFDKTEINLGKLLAGVSSKASFRFENIGDENLKISQVSGPCDCIETHANDTEIAPGKSSSIEATIKTSGYKGDLTKEITVVTNDPDHPVLVLSVKCDVQPIATVSPEQLNFGTIRTGTVIQKVLTITPMNPEVFGIQRTEPVGTHVSVKEVKKAGDDKGTQTLTIVVSAGDTPGRVLERVKIVTTLPGSPAIELLIFGNIAGETKDEKHS